MRRMLIGLALATSIVLLGTSIASTSFANGLTRGNPVLLAFRLLAVQIQQGFAEVRSLIQDVKQVQADQARTLLRLTDLIEGDGAPGKPDLTITTGSDEPNECVFRDGSLLFHVTNSPWVIPSAGASTLLIQHLSDFPNFQVEESWQFAVPPLGPGDTFVVELSDPPFCDEAYCWNFMAEADRYYEVDEVIEHNNVTGSFPSLGTELCVRVDL